MSTASLLVSLYPTPFLVEQDDHDDEIVIFEEEKVAEEENDQDALIPGYTRAELDKEVVFIRSSRDKRTGDFCGETKTVQWCILNGCEEVKPGLWSGAWFFTYLLGEEEGKKAWVDSMNRRLVKESGGKAMKVGVGQLRAMLNEKQKGNRAFNRGQYKKALDSYLKAEKIVGGAVSGMYLVPHQRDELVKVLSNQSECYLRMKKYDLAIAQATTALSLDRRHFKSMLRRAKAIYYSAERLQSLNSIVAARAAEDLQGIIDYKKTIKIDESFALEAESLLKEIEMKVNGMAQQ